jgi:hypothetical protein
MNRDAPKADYCRGALVAQPCVPVLEHTSVRVYWSPSRDWGVVRVSEAGRYSGRFVRIPEGWLWS